MLLIADSGSTKCDWVLVVGRGKRKQFQTMGFNPFFHNQNDIEKGIKKNSLLCSEAKKISKLFFYSAGCSNLKMNDIVKLALKKIFQNAIIRVAHDLAAAAFSTYDGKPCISCILGTGSNSCFFDGKRIIQQKPALGYVLGDEGSGSYFGKVLLKMYMYSQLPKDIHDELEKRYKLTKKKILDNIYRKPNANVWLASFMEFFSAYSNNKFVRNIIREGLNNFIVTHVCCFKNHKKVPVHFVGSIAHYFEDILIKICDEHGISVGRIIQKPINGLVEYHQNSIM